MPGRCGAYHSVVADGIVWPTLNIHNRTGGSADDRVETMEFDLSNKPLSACTTARGDTGRLRR